MAPQLPHGSYSLSVAERNSTAIDGEFLAVHQGGFTDPSQFFDPKARKASFQSKGGCVCDLNFGNPKHRVCSPLRHVQGQARSQCDHAGDTCAILMKVDNLEQDREFRNSRSFVERGLTHERSRYFVAGDYEVTRAARMMPSFFIRLRRVLG